MPLRPGFYGTRRGLWESGRRGQEPYQPLGMGFDPPGKGEEEEGGGEGHDPKPHYSFHFGINGATRDFCSGIILLYYLIAEGFI